MTNLISASPFFIVANLQASVAHYVDKLGFEARYMAPEDAPFFAIVARDHIAIMLKQIAADVKPIPNHTRHKWAPWDTYIYASNPDVLFEEYRAKGVAFRRALENNDDGLRGFEVTDIDEYVLFFGRPISEER
jgi:catechol 2,3-dioxygenase-like lactoylglutathione lyase family enzyme